MPSSRGCVAWASVVSPSTQFMNFMGCGQEGACLSPNEPFLPASQSFGICGGRRLLKQAKCRSLNFVQMSSHLPANQNTHCALITFASFWLIMAYDRLENCKSNNIQDTLSFLSLRYSILFFTWFRWSRWPGQVYGLELNSSSMQLATGFGTVLHFHAWSLLRSL